MGLLQNLLARLPAAKPAPELLQADRHGVCLGGSNGGFINTGVVHGNVLIVQGQSHPMGLQIPFRQAGDLAETDLNLLRWSSRLPRDLVGRNQPMAQLQAWAQSPTKLSVAVVQGDAGVGKTRLAFELADALQHSGWQAGQLKDPSQPIAFAQPLDGCLLVVDYPEEHPHTMAQWLTGLVNCALPPWKLRVLLLCRNHATLLAQQPHLAALCDPSLAPLTLQGLAQQDPWSLFQSAHAAFAARKAGSGTSPLPLPLTPASFSHWLGRDAIHQRPLLVQAYALNLVNDPSATDRVGDALVHDIVAREEHHFTQRCAAQGLQSCAAGAWLLQVLSGITGGLSLAQLHHLHAHLPPASLGGRALPTQAQWRTLLGNQATHLPALEPDLFAAHALHTYPDATADGWPAAALPVLMALDQGAPDYAQTLAARLNGLVRLNWDRPQSQRGIAGVLVGALFKVVAADHAAPAWWAYLQQNPLAPALVPLAVALERGEVGRFEALYATDAVQYGVPLARSLNNLSVHFGASGDQAAGLAAIRRAVEIREKLALDNFAAHGANLASSLNNLSVDLAESGDQAAGLAAVRRAVEIREKLAQDNFAAYGADLASSLYNLSVDLAASGEPDDLAEAKKLNDRALELIAPFALPGTTHSQWQEAMQRLRDDLARFTDAAASGS